MAFNMQDDLEEGHFDAAGNFIFDKVSLCIFFHHLLFFFSEKK